MTKRVHPDIFYVIFYPKPKEANEIDIVALSIDGQTALVAEVKRQQRNYDHKAFLEKVDCIKTSILSKHKIETHLFMLEYMRSIC